MMRVLHYLPYTTVIYEGKMQIVLLALQIITPGERGAGPNMKH